MLADTLRLCAQSLTHSKSALGAKYRRLRVRLGAPKAIVAIARHLARLVYRMLRYRENYVEKGIEHYERKFRLERIKWLKKEARLLNFQLVVLNSFHAQFLERSGAAGTGSGRSRAANAAIEAGVERSLRKANNQIADVLALPSAPSKRIAAFRGGIPRQRHARGACLPNPTVSHCPTTPE